MGGEIIKETAMTCRGHIEAGAIVLDEPANLPDGARVQCVLIPEIPDIKADDLPRPCHAGLLKFAGIVKDSPPDAAENLDHYLYGAPKK